MSDTTTTNTPSATPNNTSFFSNLVNTVKYKAHKAVYDPNAEEYAKNQASSSNNVATTAPLVEDSATTNTTDTTDGDPNTVSATRIAKKVGSQTLNILKQIFIPFTALMLAMIVTNEMIVYSVPIRIIFFIFVFLICFFIPFYAIILAIFYIFKGGYSYYINNMTNKPKQRIMPTIFALLPITRYQPTSALLSFLMYPFTYPKTDLGKQELPLIMNDYFENLKKSFKSFETIKSLPIFADNIKNIRENFDKMVEITTPSVEKPQVKNVSKPENVSAPTPPPSAPENTSSVSNESNPK
jgi:hypothetical protein